MNGNDVLIIKYWLWNVRYMDMSIIMWVDIYERMWMWIGYNDRRYDLVWRFCLLIIDYWSWVCAYIYMTTIYILNMSMNMDEYGYWYTMGVKCIEYSVLIEYWVFIIDYCCCVLIIAYTIVGNYMNIIYIWTQFIRYKSIFDIRH